MGSRQSPWTLCCPAQKKRKLNDNTTCFSIALAVSMTTAVKTVLSGTERGYEARQQRSQQALPSLFGTEKGLEAKQQHSRLFSRCPAQRSKSSKPNDNTTGLAILPAVSTSRTGFPPHVHSTATASLVSPGVGPVNALSSSNTALSSEDLPGEVTHGRHRYFTFLRKNHFEIAWDNFRRRKKGFGGNARHQPCLKVRTDKNT